MFDGQLKYTLCFTHRARRAVARVTGGGHSKSTRFNAIVRLQGVIPSGIDMVIHIDVPREAVLKRSLGRLFDPVSSDS